MAIKNYPNQVQLNYIIDPEDIQKTVNWTSTNPTIASIDSKGLVQGISKGICMCKGQINGKDSIDQASIVVRNIPPQDPKFIYNTLIPIMQYQIIQLSNLVGNNDIEWGLESYNKNTLVKIPNTINFETGLIENTYIKFVSINNNSLKYYNKIAIPTNISINFYCIINSIKYYFGNDLNTYSLVNLNNVTIYDENDKIIDNFIQKIPALGTSQIYTVKNKDGSNLNALFTYIKKDYYTDFNNKDDFEIEIVKQSLPSGNKFKITNLKEDSRINIEINIETSLRYNPRLFSPATPKTDTTNIIKTISMISPLPADKAKYNTNVPIPVEFTVLPANVDIPKYAMIMSYPNEYVYDKINETLTFKVKKSNNPGNLSFNQINPTTLQFISTNYTNYDQTKED